MPSTGNQHTLDVNSSQSFKKDSDKGVSETVNIGRAVTTVTESLSNSCFNGVIS